MPNLVGGSGPLIINFHRILSNYPVTFKNGIGTGGGWNFKKDSGVNYKIGYSIPSNIFSEFRVVAGANTLLQNKGKIKLQVCWNKKVAYDTGVTTGREPVHEAIVNVSKGGILELVFKRIGPGYPEIHVVWGNPVLLRRRNVPVWK